MLSPVFVREDIDLGPDPEGEGRAVISMVQYRPSDRNDARPAVLWVHGMSDYFFQEWVAERLHQEKYAFYAVDLRKCGRAHQEGQRWHYSEDLKNYITDLTRALDYIVDDGHQHVVPLAHSTGGLIVPIWIDALRRGDPARHRHIKALVLNSPWLDMQFPQWQVAIARPLVGVIGRARPTLQVPGGSLGTYGKSLASDWDFNHQFKPLAGHTKYFGWLRAIFRGQKQVHQGGVDVGVPTLTLCSTSSGPYDDRDAVLDVTQIKKWAPFLGNDVEIVSIPHARHDVFLSWPQPRHQAMATTLRFLGEHCAAL